MADKFSIDKRTTISIGVLIGLLPAMFWIANVNAQVQGNTEKIESQLEILQRIDERTRLMELDLQDIKTRQGL